MRYRIDNSVESTNTPLVTNQNYPKDSCVYRCMVVETRFGDDPLNITGNDTNPRMLYDCLVLGGFKAGQLISNCRVMKTSGSDVAYHERTLRKSTRKVGEDRLSEHDGEIVFVQFVQGDRRFPLIIGYDDPFQRVADLDASSEAVSRLLNSFNGVTELTDKVGKRTITLDGGTVEDGRFVRNEETAITETTDPNEEVITTTFRSGLTIVEDGKNDKVEITTKSGASVLVDGTNDLLQVKDNGTGTLKITGNKVALGADGTELLQQISDQLDKILTWANNIGATHDHIGNLGYPSAPPTQAADYVQLGSDLQTIKGKVDGIKGTL